jgi:hypothetical protein
MDKHIIKVTKRKYFILRGDRCDGVLDGFPKKALSVIRLDSLTLQ